jgi:outer membrane protein, adhesin transport system
MLGFLRAIRIPERVDSLFAVGRGKSLAIVLGMCVSLAALPGRAASLDTALGLLLLEHPLIHAAQERLVSSQYEVDKANAGFLPSVTLTGDTGPQFIRNPTTVASGQDYHRTKQVTTLTVTQMLFDGNLTDSMTDTARLNIEASRISLEATRAQILSEGLNAYIEVLRQKRLVDLSFEDVENIQHQLNLEDERVQRGSGIEVDVLEAKSRLQIAKERLVTFQGALRDSVARYKQVFGRQPDITAMMDPWPPIQLIPASMDEAIEIALRLSPTLDNSAASVELARERRRTAAAGLFPTVNLEGAANYEKNNDTTIGIRRDYTLFVRASWDLYSGNVTTASMDQATYDYRASQDTHTYTERKTIEQVRLSWQNLVTTRQRVFLLENAVSIASEKHDARVKLRAAGKETIINVLDAQNQVTSAQINYTTAAYDEKIAAYTILVVMGRLTAEDLNLPMP